MGIISGYPVGAKIVANMREQNLLSRPEAERLLAFTNNSGPLFIVGTVGITLFGNITIGYLLLITHLLACFSVGIIFRFWKRSDNVSKYKSSNYTTLNYINSKNNILYDSISNSINTIFLIGGFIVLFSVILSILNTSGFFYYICNLFKPLFSMLNINSDFCISFVTGIIELTNGVSQIATIPCKSISTNIILCSFLLGFAGICVLLQVYSIISTSDISIKPYIIGKILHGVLSAFYTYLIVNNISFFNFDLEPVFSTNTNFISNRLIDTYLGNYNIFILFIILSLILLTITLSKKKRFN